MFKFFTHTEVFYRQSRSVNVRAPVRAIHFSPFFKVAVNVAIGNKGFRQNSKLQHSLLFCFSADNQHWVTSFHLILLSTVTFKAKCFQNFLYIVILCKICRVSPPIRSELVKVRCICRTVQAFTTSRGTIYQMFYKVLIALTMFLILSQVDVSKFLLTHYGNAHVNVHAKLFST